MGKMLKSLKGWKQIASYGTMVNTVYWNESRLKSTITNNYRNTIFILIICQNKKIEEQIIPDPLS